MFFQHYLPLSYFHSRYVFPAFTPTTKRNGEDIDFARERTYTTVSPAQNPTINCLYAAIIRPRLFAHPPRPLQGKKRPPSVRSSRRSSHERIFEPLAARFREPRSSPPWLFLRRLIDPDSPFLRCCGGNPAKMAYDACSRYFHATRPILSRFKWTRCSKELKSKWKASAIPIIETKTLAVTLHSPLFLF